MYTNSQKAPVPKCGWLQVKQGKIFFECVGEGETIAFLHGFGLDSRMWAPQLEVFQATFRVIQYDLRGFGRSSLPVACDYANEDDLKALLLHLGANFGHVVGLSMGGRMELRFEAAYPEMVRSIVLADSALDGYTWSDDWQTRWRAICESAKAGRIGEAKRQWLEHPLFHSARIHPSGALLLSKMIDDYSGWHWQGQGHGEGSNSNASRTAPRDLIAFTGDYRIARHPGFSGHRGAHGSASPRGASRDHRRLGTYGQSESGRSFQQNVLRVPAGTQLLDDTVSGG